MQVDISISKLYDHLTKVLICTGLVSFTLSAAPSNKALEVLADKLPVETMLKNRSDKSKGLKNGNVASVVRAFIPAPAWMDDNAEAIWQRSPGVYKEGDNWIVVFHAAENDQNVKLFGDFTNGETGAVSLTQTPDGKFWWFKGSDEFFARSPLHGDHYRFSLVRNGETITMQDPAARWVTHSGLDSGWSKIYLSEQYQWQTSDWQRPAQSDLNIYQLHPLRFTNRNSGNAFVQVTEELNANGHNDYINNLGVTAVQMLPVNEFAGDFSWGYNPAFFYAVESSFGGPDGLKQLVDTAHSNGIAVILDVVFNHIGPGDNILDQVDAATYLDGQTIWGPMPNYNNDVTQHFFVQNLLYLAREFRIDGFRFDATNTIHNPNNFAITQAHDGGGWDFLRQLYGNVKAYDNNIWFSAEELPDWEGITADNVGSSVAGSSHGPMDSQWVDRFHDNFKEVLRGAHLDHLFEVFSHFGDSWQDATVYTESHDEVGNVDERIAKVARDGKGGQMAQIALAGTVMARGTPMVFMGQEAAEETQFHIDWWDDRLPLSQYEESNGQQKLLAWYQKLNQLRANDTVSLSSGDSKVEYIHDINGIAAFSRDNGKYLVIMNFRGTDWFDYDIGLHGGYREVANTSWPQYNLTNSAEVSRGGWHAQYFTSFHIPAYGAVILQREFVEPPTPLVDINFTCHNGYTEWGESVYAVGNIAQLGGWNTLQAFKLEPTNYPAWSATLTGVATDTAIEWKCIKQGLGEVYWQSGDNNQLITPVESAVVQVEAWF
ncbi:alpha-amylase family glycosyl hydrolase [Catenovulum sp. SX2]|uniref:alpha-amylase family glycosyl hydrolase n=1 Tax=Catenovulum sp. SX2 TaxID=3398614 RepID=UPI003F859C5F